MYFKDLSDYQYRLPFVMEGVRCVGWLDSEHDYQSGRVPDGLVEKLESLARCRRTTFDIHVNVMRGIHPCNFCGERVEIAGEGARRSPLGMSELWIPDGPGWLAAPSLVIHYMKDHKYIPPIVFAVAVDSLAVSDSFLGQQIYDELLERHSKGRNFF